LTFKLRGSKANIRHWSVEPGGKIKDFYFKLSSVIECTQYQFFRWFADHAGDVCNDDNYLNLWKNKANAHKPRPIPGYNAHLVQENLIPRIPSGSVLHLGVGQSFFDVRRYKMQPGVEVFCNMGTNGIDGCTSTFMGQCAIEKNRLCFLLVGDLSFFYDMNSIWNKQLNKNIRILLVNNNGSGLLRGHNLKAVSSVHNTVAEGWVRSTGFEYMSARSKEEFLEKLNYFLSDKSDKALFFEVICD
jgi:2-succinyl-5-enolpyruvyl-6-hydroxy-3-cyclohexene-1-carboxylate synthase